MLLEMIARVTVRIRTDTGEGTGFLVWKRNARWLVSAWHVLEGVHKKRGVFWIWKDEGWNEVWIEESERRIYRADARDIAVVKLRTRKVNREETRMGCEGIHLGDDVYLLGFLPQEEMTEDISEKENKGVPVALIKKGIVASTVTKNGTILIDAANAGGFSGGPVVRATSPDDKQARIIGVISGYKGEWVRARIGSRTGQEVPIYAPRNTGLATVALITDKIFGEN